MGALIGASAKLTVAGIGERNRVPASAMRKRVPFRSVTYSLYTFPMILVSVAIAHV